MPLAAALLAAGLLTTSLLTASLLAQPALAQSAPLTLVDRDTEVRAIGFRFTDTQTFAPGRIKEHIALTEQGRLYGLRRTLSILPLIARPGVHPFSPVDLARDAVRIERFYQRNGFLFPEADWLVRLDTARNVVRVLFTVTEGPPLLISSLVYETPGGRAAREQLAPDVLEEWERFKARAELQAGERLDEFRLIQLEDDALSWARNRGYAFASVRSRTAVDSAASRAAVTVVLDAGPRARFGEIALEGNERVRDRAIRRELPFRTGDRFSQRRLVDGQREVFSLNIFQIALADVPEQPADSTVDVRIRVREAPPRVVSAQTGYLSEAGLTGQAEWTHRNFLGDARTLTATALANTGFAALATEPDRRYRGAVTLRQPYFFDRRVSATASGFAEFRDDFRDRSRAFGGEGALLYERGQFRNASVGYRFEDRRVDEFRFGGAGGLIERQLNLADQLSTNLSQSAFFASGTYGSLDDALNPRRGYVVRPSLQVTIPFPAVAAVEYQRLGLSASGYLPFGRRLTLAGRAGAGRLFPRGPEPQDPDQAFIELLRLRNVVYLAGGTQDVRGWGPGQLGPKAVDVLFDTAGDDDNGGDAIDYDSFSARRYFPYGGTLRATATAEARFAVNDFLGAFAFLDAGRVWTPDAAYQVDESYPIFDGAYGDAERVFFGTGAGVSFASPVGAIQVSLGYKINPSFFDVRDPNAIAEAFGEVLEGYPAGTPLEDLLIVARQDLIDAAQGVDASFWRRLRLHLSIGQTF